MSSDTNMENKSSFWEKLKIRWKILLIMIPVAIIPLVIIVLFTSIRIYGHLEKQGKTTYTAYMSQVSLNMGFIYEQYARTFSNMVEIPAFVHGVHAPAYKSMQDERDVSRRMIGDVNTRGGIRQTIEEKIDGIMYIVELDRHSIANDTPYKIHFTTSGQPQLNIEQLLVDPLFTKIKGNNQIKLVFGKLQSGVIEGETYGDTPVMIFPYYENPPEKEEDTFTKFMLVAMSQGFLGKFYNGVEPLQYGTMYILDTNNNIMVYNHPRDDEDYTFSEEKNKYILEDNDPKGYGGMTFADYQMLNTDASILQNKTVSDIINQLDENQDVIYEQHIISHNGKKFLLVLGYEGQSQMKLVYFYPIKQFQKPIMDVVVVILIISVIMMLIIAIISVLFSKTITNPINTLLEATKVVTEGNYNHFIKTSYQDEIGDLSQNFNQMIKNIKSYQDRLLSSEREKSELELASKIQTCLLPQIPSKEYYDVSATMLPAAEVGGDYYDIIQEDNGRIWFGIGDVSGHGLTSGLIMMMAQTAFNTILLNDPLIDSDKLVAHVNKVMFQNIKQRLGEDHFMTLSFMVANPDGTVCLSGCHLDVLIYRAKTKKVERFVTSGVWLGLIPDIEANTDQLKFKLEKDDFMFLYTDGLIECTNEQNEQFDMPRLISKLEEYGDMNVNDIGEHIIADVYGFMKEQKDDITFVIARKS